MYSEILAAADRNMDRMMIDEMREEIANKDAALAEQQARIEQLSAELEKFKNS